MLTESHNSFQVRRPKLNHDRVGVTVYDFGIMSVAVLDSEFCFNLLQRVNNFGRSLAKRV